MGNLRSFQAEFLESFKAVDFTADDLSPWLRYYIQWHQKVRSNLDGLENQRFLIVEKGRGDLENNLKNIPYFLWLAARHRRILLLSDWDISICGLQDYLIPNQINWTLPSQDLLESVIDLNDVSNEDYYNRVIQDRDMLENKEVKVLRVRGSQLTYLKGLDRVFQDSDQDTKIFKYIFSSVFRLSEPVEKLLNLTMRRFDLVNKDYIALDLRFTDPYTKTYRASNLLSKGIDDLVNTELEEEMLQRGKIAINATKSFFGQDKVPFYVAGDTVKTMTLLQEKIEDDLFFFQDEEKVYVDSTHEDESTCTQFYPELVDLWILSGAKCIGFGIGDFGPLATMMSGFECWAMHQRNSLISTMGPESPFFHLPHIPGHSSLRSINSIEMILQEDSR